MDNIARILSDAVNPMGSDTKDIAESIDTAIEREHRTLQQQTIAVLAQVLYAYADAPSDGRNAAAVRLCQHVKATLDAEQWAYNDKVRLPTI